MKKKMIGTVLTIVMVISALTGCGQKAETENKDVVAETVENQSENTQTEENSTQDTKSTTAQNSETNADLIPLNYALAFETNEVNGILKIASDKGYLDEELGAVGYKINVLGFAQAGPAINEAFAGGSIDIADYGNLPAVVAKSNDVGISIIGVENNKSDFAVIVKADSDINTVKDLEGKRVIVGTGTILEQYWDRLVKENGIDLDKVEVINDVATASSTFVTGSADAWISSVTYLDALKSQQVEARAVESTTENHPEWAGETVFAVRDDFKKEHPEVVTAFLTAYLRAYNYAIANEEETYQNLTSKTLSAERAKELFGQSNPPFVNFSGEISSEEVEKQEELIEFLLSKGYISQKIDVNELIDTSFYEEAAKKIQVDGNKR